MQRATWALPPRLSLRPDNHTHSPRRLQSFVRPLADPATKYSCGQCCFNIENDLSGTKLADESFYSKVIRVHDVHANDFLVAGSSKLSDAALAEAALTVARMSVKRPDLLSTLIKEGVHLAVMAATEATTDVPEHQYLAGDQITNWDQRARGISATKASRTVSCAEENLLCDSSDDWARKDWGVGENVCVHEVSHSLGGHTLFAPRWLDRTTQLESTVRAAFHRAEANDLWAGQYARTNENEYFAEGTQSFFDVNDGPVPHRAELKRHDPELEAIAGQLWDSDQIFPCPATTMCDCQSFSCDEFNFVKPPPPPSSGVGAAAGGDGAAAGGICSDTCFWPNDGSCDDGGASSDFSRLVALWMPLWMPSVCSHTPSCVYPSPLDAHEDAHTLL